MKHGIRLLSVLLAVLLVVGQFGVTALAASSETYNVWLDAGQGSGDSVTVSVQTDGSATDGLLTIKYDPAVLSVTEEDVEAGLAALYSANVTEPGTLLISYVASKDAVKGELLTVSFTSSSETQSNVTLEGDVYAEGGAALTAGGTLSVNPGGTVQPSPSPSAQPSPSPSPKPGTSGGAKTGDEAAPVLWLAVALVCACGAGFALRRLRRDGV